MTFKIWLTVWLASAATALLSLVYGMIRYPTLPADQMWQYGFVWVLFISIGVCVMNLVIGGLVAIWKEF